MCLFCDADYNTVVIVVGERLNGVTLRILRDAAGSDVLLDESIEDSICTLLSDALVHESSTGTLVSVTRDGNASVGVGVEVSHNFVDLNEFGSRDLSRVDLEEYVLRDVLGSRCRSGSRCGSRCRSGSRCRNI